MSDAFSRAFLKHAGFHPLMRPQDAVKFAFQSEFGAEHFVESEKASLERLSLECAGLSQREGEPLFEALSSRFFRLNLAPAREMGASLSTVNAMFLNTANRRRGTQEGFFEKLSLLETLCAREELPFAGEEISTFLAAYRESGCPVLSHSEEYRAAYDPAYRVVDAAYAYGAEVFFRIDALLEAKERVDVAIDGRCASGKSTFASVLSGVYDCNVFHADDYFLQDFQRTEERLKEPGGNVDYERLKEEIIDHLGQRLMFRPFDCSHGTLRTQKIASAKRLNIVEGSYSMHPKLEKAYDLTVFLDVEPEEQLRRIAARGGDALLDRFQTEWIPMENLYFEAFSIREKADIALSFPTAPQTGQA